MTTAQQRENAELLRDLGRPAEAIAANAELPIEVVKAWLRSGKWPAVDKQRTLFDIAGASPRETTKPVTNLRTSHGLHLFAISPGGNPVSTKTHSSPEQAQ